jgi:hypothetical protein
MGLQPWESGRFTSTGADIGYRAAGEDVGRAGAKSNECRKDRSDEVMEVISVSVNLDIASFVKRVIGGGTRLSDGSEELASSCRPSAQNNSLHRSADYAWCYSYNDILGQKNVLDFPAIYDDEERIHTARGFGGGQEQIESMSDDCNLENQVERRGRAVWHRV